MKYLLRKTIINIYRKISFFTVRVLGFHSDSYIEILREIHNKGGGPKIRGAVISLGNCGLYTSGNVKHWKMRLLMRLIAEFPLRTSIYVF